MTYTPQLKNWEYYENLYDRRVVTQCRMTEEACEKGIQKELADNKFGKSEELIRFQHTKWRDIYLYHQKGGSSSQARTNYSKMDEGTSGKGGVL